MLPPQALELATVRALAAFCRAGGVLLSVGPLPELAESAAQTPALRQELAALFGEGGPAQIVTMTRLPSTLRERLTPDLTLARTNNDILYTHRRLEGRELYFIINNAPDPVQVRPTLRSSGPYTLYRPLTGALTPLDGDLSLALAGYEGVFVVCEAQR